MSTRVELDPELLGRVRRADPMRDPRVQAKAGLDTEPALNLLGPELDRAFQPRRAWKPRHARLRVAVLAFAVGAAVFVTANIAWTGTDSGVPSAQARQILTHARDALVWPSDAIYEEDDITTVTASTGATFSSESHEWLSTSPPYNMRLVRSWDGKVQWEQAFVNHRLDIYDPSTNTLYLAPPVAPNVTPHCRPARPCQIIDKPQWNSALSEVQSLLDQPDVTINPNAVLDGNPAIELTFDNGRFSYWIDPHSYQPLQVEDRQDRLPNGQAGVGIGRFPIARVITGSAAPASLLSLQAQHPEATVDQSSTDYAAAKARMENITPGGTGQTTTTSTTTT